MSSDPSVCPCCARQFSLTHLPLHLPCRHTLCSLCVSQASPTAACFSCHVCQSPTHVPPGQLPIHRRIYQKVMKKLSGRCEMHKYKLGWYCLDCEKTMCKKCVAMHAKHGFVEMEDERVRERVGEVVAEAEGKAKEGLRDVNQYREQLLNALHLLETHKSSTILSLKHEAKSLRAAIKSFTLESLSALDRVYSDSKASLSQLIEHVTYEQSRRTDVYRDFVATADSLKSLDICSQLKYVPKLALCPSFDPISLQVPDTNLSRFEEIHLQFATNLASFLQSAAQKLTSSSHVANPPLSPL